MDKIIYHSIVLECSTHTAFEFFTKNELLEKWLTKEADVEPKVGGKYELVADVEKCGQSGSGKGSG